MDGLEREGRDDFIVTERVPFEPFWIHHGQIWKGGEAPPVVPQFIVQDIDRATRDLIPVVEKSTPLSFSGGGQTYHFNVFRNSDSTTFQDFTDMLVERDDNIRAIALIPFEELAFVAHVRCQDRDLFRAIETEKTNSGIRRADSLPIVVGDRVVT